eukprot:745910-Amphidinium_carterae.1
MDPWIWLVLPETTTKKVLALPSDQKLNTLADELEELMLTKSGQRLFGSAWREVIHQKVEDVITLSIAGLSEETQITDRVIAKHKMEAMAKIQGIPEVSILPERRTVTIQYGGIGCAVNVRCTGEHVELALEAFARDAAVVLKQLSALPPQSVRG